MKKFFSLLCAFSIMCTIITSVSAATYSLTQTGTVSSSVGSATVTCSANYYSSGNTRWSRTWTASNPSLKATYVSSTMVIPDDKHMKTVGKVSMTNYSYMTGTATKTFKFKVIGSSVVADN